MIVAQYQPEGNFDESILVIHNNPNLPLLPINLVGCQGHVTEDGNVWHFTINQSENGDFIADWTNPAYINRPSELIFEDIDIIQMGGTIERIDYGYLPDQTDIYIITNIN